MFHGVHGASERTPCMYRSMASRVAGSSQDSGSRTVRDGTRSSCVGGSSSSTRCSSGSSDLAGSRAASVWICSDRMPGVRSMTPAQALGRQRLLQGVDPHPQAQVEDGVAVLDDHVVVAVPAVDHGRRARPAVAPGQDAVVAVTAGARQHRRSAPVPQGRRVRLAHRHEAHGVPRPELAHLPQLAARDDRRADEPAEARTVRAEDDRRVPGEVERADRVGDIVDVGRVQPGLAAVLACPRRARPDEPDAGAGRVVVHGVAAGVQLVDVGPGEELRCRVRSLGDPDLPVRHDRGPRRRGRRLARERAARPRRRRRGRAGRRRPAGRGRRGRRTGPA